MLCLQLRACAQHKLVSGSLLCRFSMALSVTLMGDTIAWGQLHLHSALDRRVLWDANLLLANRFKRQAGINIATWLIQSLLSWIANRSTHNATRSSCCFFSCADLSVCKLIAHSRVYGCYDPFSGENYLVAYGVIWCAYWKLINRLFSDINNGCRDPTEVHGSFLYNTCILFVMVHWDISNKESPVVHILYKNYAYSPTSSTRRLVIHISCQFYPHCIYIITYKIWSM